MMHSAERIYCMNQPLCVLIVEDPENDATPLLQALRHGGYEVVYAVVGTHAAMHAALKSQEWDVIISDYAMSHFSAPKALALAKKLRPERNLLYIERSENVN